MAFMSNAQSGNNTLNKEITFHADSISKSSLLDSLTKLYNLHFSYSPELLASEQKVSLNLVRQPLYSVLKQIINPELVDYKALDNQIIFFPIQSDESAEIIVPYKTLTGCVREGKKERPIPYCNIGIVGKAIGTMTNIDGDFVIKIPQELWSDTLIFSCMGFDAQYYPVAEIESSKLNVELWQRNFQLKPVDIIQYNPELVLEYFDKNISKNYDKEFSLFTTFYREMIKENEVYTDISEAVLQVMKAPYAAQSQNDHVKFLKGRKGAELKPLNDIRFRLKGGPYYITKLDIIKNQESFINPEFRHLYEYEFERKVLIDDREAAVISFSPIYSVRDILYEGKLFVDIETWAISRIEFQYTKQGLKEARHSLIQKEPKHCKAIPTELKYSVQYKLIDNKWYLFSAQSSLKVKINNREQKERTKFQSVAEILTTNIEKGDFQHFTKQEIFRSNEIFTDKIVSYDKLFWENYNVIQPEEELINALKNFENQNLVITNIE